MSDLSFLIQTQNQVVIDQNFLQKCQQLNQQIQNKNQISGFSKNLNSKQIKLNKNKTQFDLKGKSTVQKSFKNLFSTQNAQQKFTTKSFATAASQKEELIKISMRMEALEENQKRLEQKMGVQFFQLKENLLKWNRQQNQQQEQINKIKSDVNITKKKIGQLLTLITTNTP